MKVLCFLFVSVTFVSCLPDGIEVVDVRDVKDEIASGSVRSLILNAAFNKLAAGLVEAEGHSFAFVDSSEHENGQTIRVAQHYQGFQVLGYGVAVNEQDGFDVDLSGEIVAGLEAVAGEGDAQSMEERSEEVLKQTMEAHQANQVQSNGFDLENEDSATPVVYVDEELGVATKAFFVQFVDRTSDLPTHPHFILAENGIDVIRQWDGLQTRSKPQAAALASGPGGNDKIGRIRYDKQLVITDVGSGKCALENEQVVTVNLNNKKFGSKKPHQFKCYEQTDKEVNGAPSPMNDAHYYGSQVFEMYKQYYGTSPLKKTPLVLRVHYGTDYDNAFFKSGVMTFGDGGKRFYPLTALDVVAHEVSHGVTTQSSKLLYFGQSGGLNEAFSDMAGKAVQGFTRGYDSSFMWGLGSDISKNQRPLRCMDNPPCDGKSIDHVSKYRTLMNVHFSSGVYNKAFVELTKRLDSSKGLRIAFDVFYVANTRYWGRFTNFVKGAELTLKAAAHMKAGRQLPNNDYSQLSYQAIVDSFAVVGINCKRADSGRDDEWDCAKA